MLKSNTDETSRLAKLQNFIREQMAERDKQALNALLDSEEGRWFLMRLLDKTKVMSDSFTGNSATFYNEGRRKVGVDLVNEIAALGLDAFAKKQLAEREYVLKQQEFKELYIEAMKGDELDDE